MRRRYIIFSVCMCAVVILAAMCYGSYLYSEKMAQTKREAEEAKEAEKELAQTGTSKELKVTSDTKYIVEIYNADTEDMVKEERTMPSEYAGMTRSELEDYLARCLETMKQSDVETGLADMKLISFSKSELVIRKTYKDEEQERGFMLKLENGEVVIYDRTGQIIYENTGIRQENLPEEEIAKLQEGFVVESEKDLYSILENFSS